MRHRRAEAVVYALLGLVIGLVVAWLALGMSGGGHGWNSAWVSAGTLVGAPLSGVAYACRGTRSGRVLAVACLLGAIALDGLLWTATLHEGTGCVLWVWNAGCGWVLAWAILFAAWQILSLVLAASAVLRPSIGIRRLWR